MRPLRLAVLALVLLPASAPGAAGEVDTRFGDRGRAIVELQEASSHARAVAVQPDGRVLVAGTGSRGWAITRFTSSGRLDRSFGTRGRVTVRIGGGYSEPLAMTVMADRRIVVGGAPFSNGNSADSYVARLLPDGKADPSWGRDGLGKLTAPGRVFFGGMAVEPGGGVAVAATMHLRDQQIVVMRLGPDGRFDAGFGQDGSYVDPEFGSATSIVAQPGGRLLVGGQAGSVYGYGGPWGIVGAEQVLALTPGGRLDAGWGEGGRFIGPKQSRVVSMAAGPDGAVVVHDMLRSGPAVLWLDATGRRREDWGVESRASAEGAGYWGGRVAVDPSGRVYVTGHPEHEVAGVVRLAENGHLDRTFGDDGIAAVPTRKPIVRALAEAIAIGPGERVYVGISGGDREQGDREDYGFSHALVARLKGWAELAQLGNVTARRGSRRVTAYAYYDSDRTARSRTEVRDARGRLLGRATRGRLKGRHSYELRVALRRPARRGERLTLRVRSSNSAGQTDTATKRVRVG